MRIEYFSYLPNIDERSPDNRLMVFEKAMAVLPGSESEREIYVAGINNDGHIVLSTLLNPIDSNLIHSARIGIEAQYIPSYKSIKK